MLKFASLVLTPFIKVAYATGSTNHRGWGEKFRWYTLEDGFEVAKSEKKPVMVIVHKQSCKACQHQKSWFSRSTAILNLSQSFVMVNLEQSEVPNDRRFSPDGTYVPRILFFDPEGHLKDIKSMDGDYEYNYRTEQDLIRKMRIAAEQ
ncbi:Thioredoxin domain-containing protein 12 [Bulinus truncatus]|nr:Thioredoxin domain-containing protein 12 [Bulinus truncatus]